MSYIVTWWEGDTQQSVARKDEKSALETAMTLRMRSDTYVNRSLVPIRVMAQDVHERMQAMVEARDETRCRHGLLRLCVKCLSSTA